MTLEEVKIWRQGCRDTLLAIEQEGLWRCPECKHLMTGPPRDFNICSMCSVEFGYSAKELESESPLWSAVRA